MSDFSVDLLKALLWQHDNAPALTTLIRRKQDWYNENQAGFWQDWYRDVFNIDTANEFGLYVWSRILNVRLGIPTESTIQLPHFGFGTEHLNFSGPFGRQFAGEQGLTLEQKRLVIRLRYFQLVTRGAVSEINEFMVDVFKDRGRVYVMDYNDMTAIYWFEFQPDASLIEVLDDFDLLPRPATVDVQWRVIPRPSWGFGANNLNFGNGSFGA